MLSVILCFQMQNFKIKKKKILSLWNSGCMASLQQYPASLRNPVLSSCLHWGITESVIRTRDGMPGPQDRAGTPRKSWRVWTHSLIRPAVSAQGRYCGSLLYTVPLVEVKVHGFRVLGNSRPARKDCYLTQRTVLSAQRAGRVANMFPPHLTARPRFPDVLAPSCGLVANLWPVKCRGEGHRALEDPAPKISSAKFLNHHDLEHW